MARSFSFFFFSLFFLLTAGIIHITTANLIFTHIQPTCDSSTGSGCLRGQTCLADQTCIDARISNRAVGFRGPDGRCGETSSEHYRSPLDRKCQRGGCDSEAKISIPAISPTTSQHHHHQSEPVLGSPTASGTAAATGAVTADGTCGAKNGDTICGNWHLGSCCSMYGFCGNTLSHCGAGCQSGPCDQAPSIPVPSPSPAPLNANPGAFRVVGDSGVPAMHAALLPNGKVVFLDKVENFTKVNVSETHFAYSAEYDPVTNERVPLAYRTNAFCAGGSFLANGTLISIGGNGPLNDTDDSILDGFRGLRWLTRSSTDSSLDGQEWFEIINAEHQLDTPRWYASGQIMPDGTVFVSSGSLNGLDPAQVRNNNPTYEILDINGVSRGESIPMEILIKTQPYYMYPFLHLLRDGNLFVFVSKTSEIFNVGQNQTVKTFPDLAGDFRTYPCTGGSVLLPLSSENEWEPEVVICGGCAYQDISAPTDASCGRIQPLRDDPVWEMDSMPEGRTMVESILLPDGTVLWLNGANRGAQGFLLSEDPTTTALIYDPTADLGKRWTSGASSTIPRLYHSVALLLLDGTVMVAGSNPVQMPVLKQSPGNEGNVTQFQVEIYTPPYLSGDNAERRPSNIELSTMDLKADSSTFEISFTAPEDAKAVKVALYHGGFVTHSLHMGHRMAFLDTKGFEAGERGQKISVTMPPTRNVAPPGPYVVYVVLDGVPGMGQFVMVS
ncbi:galactose oxidase [Lecanosticta acicola]|uniref:Galactose oxidase n=1 Tax=Lecanosticta acicola TaxID=111012 RepID=A0AAI8W218_9PEZI|nr:galactose oxidase [Lecanosticta acicola]